MKLMLIDYNKICTIDLLVRWIDKLAWLKVLRTKFCMFQLLWCFSGDVIPSNVDDPPITSAIQCRTYLLIS